MSEPSKLKLKNIVQIFLSEYNKANRTTFEWNDKKSYLAKSSDRKWVDAIAYNNKGKELQIQHKEIIWDVKYDKIRSGVADKIVRKLIEKLTNYNLFEIALHLNFYQKRLIVSDAEIEDFCYWIVEFINLKLNDGYPKSYHLFLIPKNLNGYWLRLLSTLKVFVRGVKDAFYVAIDKTNKVRQHIYSYDKDDEIYLSKINEVTSYISIFRNPGQRIPVVGWGYSELDPRPLPHFGDVVVSEINRKVVNRYNNLIVLLDCNRYVDEYDRELIVSQVKQITFVGQIWIIENFVSRRKATCIFNSNNIESTST